LGTAQAIKAYAQGKYEARITVDGLQKSERNRFAVGLRKQSVRTKTVRGGKDEIDIFIRLADALCGFLRQALTGRAELDRLMTRATREGYLIKVEI